MEKLIHFLLPRESNNHKAKILHSSSLLVLASFLVLFQIVLNLLPKLNPSILGYASNISPSEVVRLTNEKRAAAGLSALSLNQELSAAAYTKGQDMIAKDYWAHIAPDGTEPWKFFKDFGYKYRYAGENLARDFSNANDAVNAWMNSPAHRENMLNPKYKEIGIGVVEGDLAGVDTTIVVQFFGAMYTDKIVQPIAQAAKTEKTVVLTVAPTIIPTAIPISIQTIEPQVRSQILISPFTTTRTLSLIVVAILLLVFIVDAVLVSKRRITRVAGRTFAHVVFLGMILSIILILKAGNIL
ncbi:MAG: CAP domain-containing protein [Patescibacteria group bacterium]